MRALPLLLGMTVLALAAVLAGCGKSLPATGAGQSAGQPLAPVTPEGAGGLTTKNTTRLGGADVATDAAAVALAVHPGLTAATRPQAVVVVDEHDWPAALAASALASSPLLAPLLYSDGDALPEVSAQALKTMRPTGAAALGGAQVIQVGTSATPAPPTAGYDTHALGSASPYALAVQVQQLLSVVQHHEPRQVIVVAADGPPALAMPAAGLAAESGAPILFVSAAGVPAATASALTRLRRPAIYVVGSTAAVSSATLSALGRYGAVKRIVSPVGRIGRDDPVGNAIAVALFEEGAFGWGADEPGRGLVFANATRPLDAPAAAPLASSGDYAPLLLLEGPVEVPKVLSEYLTDIRPAYSNAPAYRATHGTYNHGWVIGDESAISATTQAELDTMLEIAPQTTTSSEAASSATSSTSTTTTETTLPTHTK
jgi:Cell wall binding domain 2 (CWB2)